MNDSTFNFDLLLPELQRALARQADAQTTRLERLVVAMISAAPITDDDAGRPERVADAIMKHARALDALFPDRSVTDQALALYAVVADYGRELAKEHDGDDTECGGCAFLQQLRAFGIGLDA